MPNPPGEGERVGREGKKDPFCQLKKGGGGGGFPIYYYFVKLPKTYFCILHASGGP